MKLLLFDYFDKEKAQFHTSQTNTICIQKDIYNV